MASNQHTVEQLFGAVLDQLPEKRAAFLDEACRSAPRLRRQVEDLLLANQDLGSFLEQPLLGSEIPAIFRDSHVANDAPAEPSPDQPLLRKRHGLQPGQLINDRFRIIRFIARGGMGEIYEVEDLFLQNVRVALKVILPNIAANVGSSRQFEQEVLLARKVIHPNLCQIYDIARSHESGDPFLFLTMKLLSGETLACRLQREYRFSEEEELAILHQMCAGLAALHDAGIVHRDIKPTNVMLEHTDAALRLCIMDFGLARISEPFTTREASGLVAGTPGYLAPELLEGARPTKASDIYALGVLLQRLLNNEQADLFDGSDGTRRSVTSNRTQLPLLRYAAAKFRDKDPNLRCSAFLHVQDTLAVSARGTPRYRWPLALRSAHKSSVSRRGFVVGGITTAAGVLGVTFLNRERLGDLLHPLPKKRFVALLTYPASTDVRLQQVLLDVADTIGRELLRAEAYDRNLLIIADTAAKQITNAVDLRAIRDSYGANLLLAISGNSRSDYLDLSLKLLDANAARPLRERSLRISLHDRMLLPPRAVTAAAELLDVSKYTRDEDAVRSGTDNAEAYAAFQEAETLRKRDTVTSLGEAIARYQDALKLDPRYAVAMAKLSWAYLRTYALHGDPAALILARDTCTVAISRDPSLIDAHLVFAWVYEQTGDKAGASRELATALSIDPSDPGTLRFQARFFAENGRLNEAEDRLRRLIRVRPNLWLAHNELGSFLYDRGRYDDALLEYHAAQISAPRNIVPLYNTGSVLLQQGKLSQAKQVLEKSFALEPSDIAAVNLAAVARARGVFQEAVQYAQKAVRLNPEDPANLLELGDSYQAAGSRLMSGSAYRQAAEKQEEQLRIQRSNGSGWLLLALCRAKLGTRSAASAALERADALHADDMESQLLKARTLELLGRREDAIRLIHDCLNRGATNFQVHTMPDLVGLRSTPQFHNVMESLGLKTQ